MSRHLRIQAINPVHAVQRRHGKRLHGNNMRNATRIIEVAHYPEELAIQLNSKQLSQIPKLSASLWFTLIDTNSQ
ncbi:hypothetical protein [Mycobacterium uberis]|uniref:hypothetical protein n=1 Tax=Mycobacterium uberis TaxID=2162698 RepID=UPI001401EB68|nr:hypothetical protein [Mycobacterium uberis]